MPLLAGPAPAVLGLDLATACGWALCEGDRITRSGAIDLRLKGQDPPGARFLRLARFLQAGPWPAGMVVAYEDVRSHTRRDKATGRRFEGTTAAHVYGGLLGITLAWAAAAGLDTLPIGVGQWKAALGCAKGSHSSKGEVMAAVQRLGYRPATQDEADAIGVALFSFRSRNTFNHRAHLGSRPDAVGV